MPREIYTIRKKLISFPHTNFHIFDEHGQVVMYCRMKAFKLKEDLRIYTNEDMQEEVLRIHARSVLDFGATYDLFDPATGEKIGGLRRKGMRSMVRDEWAILDANEEEVGLIQEDNMTLALIRRGISIFSDLLAQMLPQHFTASLHGMPVIEFQRHLNPVVQKMDIDFTPDAAGKLDRRLGFAAALVLSAIEGRVG